MMFMMDFAFDCYVKLGREEIFEGNSEPMTIADVSSGGLYVYYRGLRNISDVSDWQINAYSLARLRYTDYYILNNISLNVLPHGRKVERHHSTHPPTYPETARAWPH